MVDDSMPGQSACTRDTSWNPLVRDQQARELGSQPSSELKWIYPAAGGQKRYGRTKLIVQSLVEVFQGRAAMSARANNGLAWKWHEQCLETSTFSYVPTFDDPPQPQPCFHLTSHHEAMPGLLCKVALEDSDAKSKQSPNGVALALGTVHGTQD